MRSGGTLEGRLKVKGFHGQVRLVIRCRHASPTSWSMSLILNSKRFNGRIDCIDWEPLFVSIDGTQCSGFHRHIWNAKAMSCDRFKLAMPRFQPRSAEEFIVLGVRILNVAVNKEKLQDVSLPMPIH